MRAALKWKLRSNVVGTRPCASASALGARYTPMCHVRGMNGLSGAIETLIGSVSHKLLVVMLEPTSKSVALGGAPSLMSRCVTLCDRPTKTFAASSLVA